MIKHYARRITTSEAIRHSFAFVTFLLTILFLSLTDANAQSACNYRFLEVLDNAGKSVANAKVETIGLGGSQQTDTNGVVKELPVCWGDNNTEGLRVSKPSYFTYEETKLFLFERLYWPLLHGELPQYESYGPIKIVLLKTPVTEAERKAVKAEQRGRELLIAVKQDDAATVLKLLRDGASPNTTDVYGIPAILWAAASGDKKKIEALLSAGADVRNKGGSGRKVLLYYLYNLRSKDAVDVELVQRLIKAGADVNASDKVGTTALSLARQYDNATIIKLLESSGAH